jgi:hypothetical protein
MSKFVVRGRDRASLYQEISDKIVAKLEVGRVPGRLMPAYRCYFSVLRRVRWP